MILGGFLVQLCVYFALLANTYIYIYLIATCFADVLLMRILAGPEVKIELGMTLPLLYTCGNNEL